MAKAEAVPFYRFQLPLPQKFAAFTASSFCFHIPARKSIPAWVKTFFLFWSSPNIGLKTGPILSENR